MKEQTLKVGQLYRSLEFDRAAMDDDKRTVELSFSSELPVERWFGYEILDHADGSVRMDRMNGGAPLLMEHDRTDQVGVIEKAWIDPKTRKGRALVRFGSSERAKEIYQDVKDGIRRLVSVGYRIYRMVTEKVENDVETLRAMSWEPMEISIVSVPADPSVGVGRGDKTEQQNEVTVERKQKTMSETNTAPLDPKAIRSEIEISIRNEHKQRMTEINAIVGALEKKYPGDAEVAALRNQAVVGEISLDDLRSKAFAKFSNATPITNPNPNVGMTERDIKDYSFQRAILCAARNKYDGLEGEMHQEAVKKYKMSERANGIIVPQDVLAYGQRDQLVGTGTLGGNLVQTNLLAGSFIELLRNRMIVSRLGATYLNGLVGNVAIPRQSGGATAYWAASEVAATTETSATFDQVTMTPKQVTGRIDYSWLLMNQGTPSIEQLVRNDLINVLARAVDLAALHGSGSSGQPTGIAATSGIGSVTLGPAGAAPTWAGIVNLEREVSIDNADLGTLAYLTNAQVRGKLKTTLKNTTGTDAGFILGDTRTADGFGMLNGYNCGFSQQVASNLTKSTVTGTLSAIFFGNWADLLIGQWSGIELLTNPYTQAANRVIEVYAYQALDIAVRHPESFAYTPDVVTT